MRDHVVGAVGAPEPRATVHRDRLDPRVLEDAVVAREERRQTEHVRVQLDDVDRAGALVAHPLRGLTRAEADHQGAVGVRAQEDGQAPHPRHVVRAAALVRRQEAVDEERPDSRAIDDGDGRLGPLAKRDDARRSRVERGQEPFDPEVRVQGDSDRERDSTGQRDPDA
jgi:hypothetical protein